MGAAHTPPTSRTLLGRLARVPADQEAWAEFARRYGERIYGWCRGRRLQEADAEEVTQQVLVKLAVRLQTFTYDPSQSFRAWLQKVVLNAWRDFLDSRHHREAAAGDSEVLDMLESAQARDELVADLDAEFERELLDEAMARVKARVQPHTWDAFRMLALENRPGAEVATRLGIKVATAFVARSKVQKMLKEELARLRNPRGG
jgi:RNA polymerase sigma-70 factor (ECF subfamily)